MINNGNTELATFELDMVTIQVYARDADKTVLLDVMDNDSAGDWVYCRMSVEQAKEFAQCLIDICNLLEVESK